jgi:hypothetical protein
MSETRHSLKPNFKSNASKLTHLATATKRALPCRFAHDEAERYQPILDIS